MVKDIEENEQGMKLTLDNGNNICIKECDSYFISESVDDFDKDRMINVYRGLISELSQFSEETVRALIPSLTDKHDSIR